jgi:tryptophan halogenase
MQINSIVIVGGGSSGWFAASMINKHCPEINVTLVESPDISTIGVGESSTLHINWFLQSLEVEDEDWMPHCDATYKATIKFTDFHKKGEFFHYPFGIRDFKFSSVKDGQHDLGVDAWFFKKWFYPETPQTDFAESYWPVMQMVNKNKIHSNEDGAITDFNMKNDWAYQFDATKLGIWMKNNLCSDTEHILDHVTNTNLDERGWISSLSTKEHGELKADLYIDCTGFSSVLLEKALDVSHTNYKDMLINNGAWATKIPYVDPNVEMEMTTDGTAIDNGWVWNIPLFNRIGSGYVYSDKFIDKEIALKEYKEHLNNTNQWCRKNDVEELEYQHINIKNGIHKKAWHKNCIAIGLSYGFIEPLESTGISVTIEGLRKLITVLQSKDRHVNQFDRDCVNREMQNNIKEGVYFVAYHFFGSIRDDSEYWKWYTQELEMGEQWINGNYSNISPEENLSYYRFHKLTLNSLTDGMQCVAVGHHTNLHSDFTRTFQGTRQPPFRYDGIYTKTQIKEFWKNSAIEKIFEYWKERNEKINLLADKSPTQYEYLKEKIYNQT